MPLQQGISQEVYCHRYIYDSEAFHSTVLNVFQTVLNVTGRGKANVFSARYANGEDHYMRITVDGNIVVNDRVVKFYQNIGVIIGVYDFNISFQVEHRSLGGVNPVNTLISYCA